MHFRPLPIISYKPRYTYYPTLKSHIFAPHPIHRFYFTPPRARTRDVICLQTHRQAARIATQYPQHTFLNTNANLRKPTHQTITYYTPYHPEFWYKDNTKSSEIQIYFRFFAKMVHFAFLACNTLTLNTKKSSFFQWFPCTFPKMAFLTKIVFQFVYEDSNNKHQDVSINNHAKDHI